MGTLLSAGDIAIVGYASDDPDFFAFVFLRNVEAGTTVNFTDNGWQAAGGFRPGEGTATFTAPTDIAAGTVVSVPVGGMAFNVFGDQIIAYQGTEASPTFLYAIDFADGNTTFAGDATSTTTSAVPTGLTLGVTAVAIPFDNAAYTGPSSLSQLDLLEAISDPTALSQLDLLEAISDPTNWTGSDTVPQPRSADLRVAGRPEIDLDFNNSTQGGRDFRTTYIQGGTSVGIGDTDIRIADSDDVTLVSATIKINDPHPDNLLSVNGTLPAGITASAYDAATGVLTLSGTASLTAYETAIGQVEFSSTSEPIGAQKRIEVTVFDGTDSSVAALAFINIVAGTASPVLDLDANDSNGAGADYTATFTEGGPATPIADIDVSITDPDSPMLAAATITLGINRQPDDVLSVNGTLPGGIIASSYNPSTGVLTLTGSASLADYQTALRQVVYSTPSTTPFTGDRVIEVTVNDGTVNSNIAHTFMHVVGVENIAPMLNLDADLSTTGGADFLTTFTDGGPPVPIADTDVLITDTDSPNLISATITLTNPHADDLLVFNGPPPLGIAASTYDPGTGVLTLTGSASLADYQTALQQITFQNTGTNPANDTRIITVVVNDGIAPSNTANAIIQVVEVNNSAPVLDLDQNDSTAPGTTFRATFTENGAAVPIADVDTTITDPDSTTLASATITLTNAQTGDLLTVNGLLPPGISASPYDPATGTLTLAGTALLVDYQTALAQIRFITTGDDPVTDNRVLAVVVNDGINNSNAATALIAIAALNDAPTIAVETPATYVENAAAVVLSPLASLVDADDSQLTFATVRITDGSFPADGDVLTVNGATSGTLDGVTFQWDPTRHALIFNGADSVAIYQALLQNVEFHSTSDNPTDFNASPTRTLEWTVSDGTATTTTTTTINVVARNDAPVVEVASTATYTENDPPTLISQAAAATDVDSLNLTAGQVTITAGAFAGDILTVNGLQSGTFAGINFSYDTTLHSLLFSLAAPVADYQTFLQAVQFQSTSDDPTNAGADPTRTLSWTVFDGRDVSTAQTTTLTIAAVNDAPVAEDDVASGNEDTAITTGNVLANDSDVDNVLTAGSIAAFSQGTNGSVVNNGDGTFTYAPNANFNGIDSFTYTIDDGAGGTATATVNLTVTPVNDAPDVAAPDSYTGTATVPLVIGGIAFSDVDGAVASEVATFAVGTGTLSAVTGGGVVVSGSGGSTLMLTGTIDSLNAFIAGSNLTYAGTQDDTLSVTIDDQGNVGLGGALTDTADVAITITQPVPPPRPPTEGDFDGDHFGDLFLYRDTGHAAIWPMHENVRQGDGTNLPNNGPTWHAKAFVDLDATGGFSDIIWQNDNGLVATWQMEGAIIVDQVNLPNPGVTNHVVDARDFDGNGGADILLQNDDGHLALWLMQDATHSGSMVTIGQNPGAPWHAVAGDFNGDGRAGLVFTTAIGGTAIWEDFVDTGGGQGEFNQQGNLQDNGPTWHLRATGDFDGDQKDDILWQNDNGLAAIWLMDGLQIKDGFTINGTDANGPTWHIITARDMNNDSRADLLFQNDDGRVALWEDFTPAGGTTATFTTQLNIVPEPNPTGQLVWHIL